MAEAKNRVHRRLWLALKVALSVRDTCDPCKVHLNFVGGEPPRAHAPGIVLACCDALYYRRFAPTLIETAKRNSPNQHVHVHVYEPDAAWQAEARDTAAAHANLTLSWEDQRRNPFRDAGRNYIYYAAARFAVASRIVELSRSPVLVVDTDGLVVRPLDEPFASFEGSDIGLIRRRTWKPWQKNLAAALMIQPTQDGLDFISRVADVLHMVLARKPEFHVDQMVIHGVDRVSSGLRVFPLTKAFADWEYLPDSYIWSAKGDRKLDFAELVRRVMTAKPADQAGRT
jgi:hypothetical protein